MALQTKTSNLSLVLPGDDSHNTPWGQADKTIVDAVTSIDAQIVAPAFRDPPGTMPLIPDLPMLMRRPILPRQLSRPVLLSTFRRLTPIRRRRRSRSTVERLWLDPRSPQTRSFMLSTMARSFR